MAKRDIKNGIRGKEKCTRRKIKKHSSVGEQNVISRAQSKAGSYLALN